MADLLKDIAQFLEAEGCGTRSVNLFRGFLPDTPDEVTVIYETGGLPPEMAMSPDGGVVQKRPSVQVVCRGKARDYDTPRTMAQAAYDALAGMPEQTIGGTRYTYARPRQEPFGFGRDANSRVLVACNYDVMRDAA